MQQFRAGILFNNARALGQIAELTHPRVATVRVLRSGESLDTHPTPRDDTAHPMPDELRNSLRRVLGNLELECRTLRFKSCFATVSRLQMILDEETATLRDLKEEAEQFEDRLIDELRETSCFALEGRGEELFLGVHHFGEAVSKRFPGTVVDIEEAAKCLAFDRGTACVFHLMRVLEIGLQELAHDLRIEHLDRNWQTLLNNVQRSMKALPHMTEAEKEYQARRSGAVAHLQNVKDAWRNEVMHPRSVYTVKQARDIWNHTEAFMKSLVAFL